MKKLQAKTTRNLRELINFVNDYNADSLDNPINKEDIVLVLKGDGQYYLIYFN